MSVCIEVDNKLYTSLKKIVGNKQLNLFNSDGNFTEVIPTSTFKFLIPIGFFSSSNVILKKEFETNTNNILKSTEKITRPILYPLQNKVVSNIRDLIKKNKCEKRPLYFTLHLACGFGKTITSCYLIISHNRRAVICVPNKMLIYQWKSVIENTGISYVISVEGVSNLLKILSKKDVDVLIIVSRHLSNEKFCKYINNKYDIFILDESHTYNLMNNSAITRFLTFYPPKICYFLTATPRSSNRIYCNEIINISRISEINKIIKIIDYFFNAYSSDKIRNMVNKLNPVSNKYHIYTEKILSEDIPRNNMILDTIVDEYNKYYINRILVITKLREHMKWFYTNLSKKINYNDVFLGDAQNKNTPDIIKNMKTRDRFIYVSTMFYSGTGLDIPTLDSLIICSAVMNNMQMEQLLGRICRDGTGKRVVYVFPTTSIKEIRNTIGFFTQKLITLSIDKLGFKRYIKQDNGKYELALYKALNLQNH
nr:DNA helicase [Wadden Sea poxvirus]